MRPALALSLICLVSCASGPGGFRWRPGTPIGWPDTDPEPRITVEFAYHGAEDARREQSGWARLGEWLAGPSQLHLVAPFGMALTAEGELLIADTSLRAVHRLSLETAAHDLIGGSDEQPLTTPVGVAVVPDGRVFVSDSGAGRVVIFSPQGEVVGVLGPAEGLERPTGIVHDALEGRLLVVDTTACRILAYGLDGKFLGVWGERGSGPGQYNYPTGIAVGPDGSVYVTDSLNFRVQILSPSLDPVSAFGIAGSGPGTFSKPKGIALDSEGHVYVVDSMFDNVQVFERDGRLLLTFCARGAGLGQLFLPTGILIDAHDRVYVADSGNARIQVFQYHGRTP